MSITFMYNFHTKVRMNNDINLDINYMTLTINYRLVKNETIQVESYDADT